MLFRSEYNLSVYVNPEKKGIGYDFNFALNCVEADIVTLAHQDDIYESTYLERVVKTVQENNSASIVFTDYYEIRNNQNITNNTNHVIKSILLTPLKIRGIKNTKFSKRFALAFGNSICCPAVSFVKDNIETKNLFKSDLLSNVDWLAWEKLSRQQNKFVYINEQLVGHTISENTTTTSIIVQGIRTKEDFYMFKKFWPKPIAKCLQKVYSFSEKSNNN